MSAVVSLYRCKAVLCALQKQQEVKQKEEAIRKQKEQVSESARFRVNLKPKPADALCAHLLHLTCCSGSAGPATSPKSA